jgi:hypothetical protein
MMNDVVNDDGMVEEIPASNTVIGSVDVNGDDREVGFV